MLFEFDPAKDTVNLAKHGLSLLFGRQVFDDSAYIVIPTIRIDDEEERSKAVGIIAGKLYTVIHIWRGAAVRLISVRRSNATEQRDYDRHSGGPG